MGHCASLHFTIIQRLLPAAGATCTLLIATPLHGPSAGASDAPTTSAGRARFDPAAGAAPGWLAAMAAFSLAAFSLAFLAKYFLFLDKSSGGKGCGGGTAAACAFRVAAAFTFTGAGSGDGVGDPPE